MLRWRVIFYKIPKSIVKVSFIFLHYFNIDLHFYNCINFLASSLVQTIDPNCMEPSVNRTDTDINGYIFQSNRKERCRNVIGNKTNLIFHVEKTDIESCVVKCSSDYTCSFFSISGSNVCKGFKECTKKMPSKRRNKLYRKGNYICIAYHRHNLCL